MDGVTIGTKHSYADFGLILSKKEITLPKAKTETVDVPGHDGLIDLTESLVDDVKFANRTITLTFTVLNAIGYWTDALSALTNYLHGRKLRIIFDADKTFYYYGRCSVDQYKTDKRTGTIVMTCDAEPFKVEVNSTSEPWVWDTFSFVNGIIHVSTVTVTGTKTVNLINRRKVVSPTFKCSARMTVSCNGHEESIPAGTTTVVDIRLVEGDNPCTFTGNGTVTITYRGGSL